MRRLLALLLLLALPIALAATDCDGGAGAFRFKVLGPEQPSNLWQFAMVRGWMPAFSAMWNYDEHHGGRLAWVASDGAFEVDGSPCNWNALNQTLMIAVEYTSGSDTPAQRAFIAAMEFDARDPALPLSDTSRVPAPTMVEVPPATVTQDAGTVTITWADISVGVYVNQFSGPSPMVVQYRVVRSADGIAGWTDVTDVAAGVQTATDSPGPGTWYYAIEIRYPDDGTNAQVSPHGLAAEVIIP